MKLTTNDAAPTPPPPPPPAPVVVPVAIGTLSLPAGRMTVAYDAFVQATGGKGAYAWSMVGTLPAGLGFDGATGRISGTPALAGTFAVTISAADTTDPANSATAALTIVIGAPPVSIATTTLPAGRATIAYAASAQASGGSGSFRWSVTAGALPAGLVLDTGTGKISGTPTTAGTYPVTLTAADAADATNSSAVTYSLVITAAVKITSPRTLPVAARGVAYTHAVQVANVQGTATWGLAGGKLPTGMTLDAVTGVITGICTTRGTYHFNARIIDANTSDTLTLTIQVK